MIIVQGKEIPQSEFEDLVARVFSKAIDLLGGIVKLAEYRTLTWLPSLARATLTVVLKEEYLRSEEEIAQKVGITKNTVRSIIRADPGLALEKIQKIEELTKEETKDLKTHTAGGIAKLAYKLVKGGEDAKVIVDFSSIVLEDMMKALEIPWAYMVLKRIKGLNFPINTYEILQEKLKDITFKEIKLIEILPHLQYPINTPAQLIKEIKEHLKMKE
ncbi:MAG: bacterio-opsin activator [Caldisericum sp.]|uniref:bacterio-opsin activator n=1 Tax=Caldisericum sp. TaxID=2499687 RepID=UPI003D09C150